MLDGCHFPFLRNVSQPDDIKRSQTTRTAPESRLPGILNHVECYETSLLSPSGDKMHT